MVEWGENSGRTQSISFSITKGLGDRKDRLCVPGSHWFKSACRHPDRAQIGLKGKDTVMLLCVL